jgi:hypothetical protein
MKYLDLESTRILKVDEIYPYSLQCDACQQIFIREPAAISISDISIHHKEPESQQPKLFVLADLEPECVLASDLDPDPT